MAEESAVTFDEVRARARARPTRAARRRPPPPRVVVAAFDARRGPLAVVRPSVVVVVVVVVVQNRNRASTNAHSPSSLPSPRRVPQSFRVRVLDAEKFDKTQALADGAKDFCEKVTRLNDIVKTVVDAVDAQARRRSIVARRRCRLIRSRLRLPSRGPSSFRPLPSSLPPSRALPADVARASFPFALNPRLDAGGAHRARETARGGEAEPGGVGGAFYTLVPIRPRSRGERRSLRTLPGASLRPPLAFNPRPRRLSTPLLTPFNSTPTFARMERPWRRRVGDARAPRRGRFDANDARSSTGCARSLTRWRACARSRRR